MQEKEKQALTRACHREEGRTSLRRNRNQDKRVAAPTACKTIFAEVTAKSGSASAPTFPSQAGKLVLQPDLGRSAGDRPPNR